MVRYSIILLFIACGVYAQKTVQATGEAHIRIEPDMSKEEAMDLARQQAMINAIDNAFGSYVEQDSDTYIDGGNADFKIIGHTLVKGDWLKTEMEKFQEEQRSVKGSHGRETEIWITCKIKGMVREIIKPQINLSIEPRDCPDPLCRTYNFNSGASMYLAFQSPAQGFLSLFMVTDEQTAYRMLPYQEMPETYLNAVPVEADKEYLFFASAEEFDYFQDFSYLMVDEIYLETVKEKEFIDLYIVFSPENYNKPLLYASHKKPGSYVLPKMLDLDDFLGWLQESRIYDPEMQYKRITLTVSK